MSEDKKMRTRYRTTNWSQYNAADKRQPGIFLQFHVNS